MTKWATSAQSVVGRALDLAASGSADDGAGAQPATAVWPLGARTRVPSRRPRLRVRVRPSVAAWVVGVVVLCLASCSPSVGTGADAASDADGAADGVSDAELDAVAAGDTSPDSPDELRDTDVPDLADTAETTETGPSGVPLRYAFLHQATAVDLIISYQEGDEIADPISWFVDDQEPLASFVECALEQCTRTGEPGEYARCLLAGVSETICGQYVDGMLEDAAPPPGDRCDLIGAPNRSRFQDRCLNCPPETVCLFEVRSDADENPEGRIVDCMPRCVPGLCEEACRPSEECVIASDGYGVCLVVSTPCPSAPVGPVDPTVCTGDLDCPVGTGCSLARQTDATGVCRHLCEGGAVCDRSCRNGEICTGTFCEPGAR